MGEIFRLTHDPLTPKEEPNMISLLKYWLRHIITLCLMIAIVFMVACTVFVIVLIANGDIRIRMVKDGHEEKKRNRNR
jgi:hypothetical protein